MSEENGDVTFNQETFNKINDVSLKNKCNHENET